MNKMSSFIRYNTYYNSNNNKKVTITYSMNKII